MNRKGRCCYCSVKAENNERIFKHMEAKHKDELSGRGADEVHYAYRNRKPPTCHLPGCDNICDWNKEKGKPDYFCSMECKKEAGRRAKKNHMKVYGTEHNLDDPKRQIKMQDNRSISGVYTCDDGTDVPYMGKAEKLCVSILDQEFGLTGDDLGRPMVFFEYDDDNNRTRTYIPDYEIYNLNCIIEVKEAMNNRNGHVGMIHKHHMDQKKERALINTKTKHYVRFHEDDIKGFVKIMKEVVKRNGKVKGEPIIYAPQKYYDDIEGYDAESVYRTTKAKYRLEWVPKDLIKITTKFMDVAYSYYQDNNAAHGMPHIIDVVNKAGFLIQVTDDDLSDNEQLLIMISMVFHDIGLLQGRETHAFTGADEFKRLYRRGKFKKIYDLTADDAFTIVDSIREHRSSSGKPMTRVGKYVNDADSFYMDGIETIIRCMDHQAQGSLTYDCNGIVNHINSKFRNKNGYQIFKTKVANKYIGAKSFDKWDDEAMLALSQRHKDGHFVFHDDHEYYRDGKKFIKIIWGNPTTKDDTRFEIICDPAKKDSTTCITYL